MPIENQKIIKVLNDYVLQCLRVNVQFIKRTSELSKLLFKEIDSNCLLNLSVPSVKSVGDIKLEQNLSEERWQVEGWCLCLYRVPRSIVLHRSLISTFIEISTTAMLLGKI